MNSFFNEKYVFVSPKRTQTEVFQEVFLELLQNNVVKSEFLENLLEREMQYPTGIDLSVVSSTLPDIALPHTESEYVNQTLIVPIKLIHPIPFKNMMEPDETLSVSFLFMILNKLEENQSILLAQIMNFISRIPPDELNTFFALCFAKEIYQFLETNFLPPQSN